MLTCQNHDTELLSGLYGQEQAARLESEIVARHDALRDDEAAVEQAFDDVLSDRRNLVEHLACLSGFRLLHACGNEESDRVARLELQAVFCTLIEEKLQARAEREVRA